jgi:hypothetical protein
LADLPACLEGPDEGDGNAIRPSFRLSRDLIAAVSRPLTV